MGPRLRISGNAIDILGGHEDANDFNPAQHVLSNASYANTAQELIVVMREQHKEGADFTKIYETGPDRLVAGVLQTPFQYSEAELKSAVEEAARLGTSVAVHATGEPGTLYAARAGVSSIDHATQLSDETMRIMKAKNIPAVPTLAVFDFFAAPGAPDADRERPLYEYKVREFKRQLAAGIPFAVGSAALTPTMQAQIRVFVAKIKSIGATAIVFTGYTDIAGGAAYNLNLGHNRALSAENYLRAVLLADGVTASIRFIAQSLGSTAPAASNNTLAGRARNRNVTVVATLS